MTPAPAFAGTALGGWLTRVTDWLDARGRPAWIAVVVLGLIFAWPLGLALLAYALWSKRMSNRTDLTSARGLRRMAPTRFRSSGNSAFDAYKLDMLKRLEDEQEAFESFLNRLREAKDKTEFDQFMDDRAKRADDRPAEA